MHVKELKPGDAYSIDECHKEYAEMQRCHKLIVDCMELNSIDLASGVGVMLKIVAKAHEGLSKEMFLKNCAMMWDCEQEY